MNNYHQGMEHNYQKRSAPQLNGPSGKRPVNFDALTQGVDYITLCMDGENVNVLMEDIQIASSMEPGAFSSAQAFPPLPSTTTQPSPVFSPPHTRNGTGYTPVHQPPPARFPANSTNIRQQHPTIQQQQQQSQQQQPLQPITPQQQSQQQQPLQPITPQQLQQLQKQNQQPKTIIVRPKQPSTYSAAAASTSTLASSSLQTTPVKSGIDPALVAKINRVHNSVFNTTTGLAAITSKVQKLEDGANKEDTVYKAEIKEIRDDISDLKAQNIQVSVDGETESALNAKFNILIEENRFQKERISLLSSLVHRQGKQLESLQLSAVITTSMFMANTIYIGGLRQVANENPRGVVTEFLNHRMNLFPPLQEILHAERVGGIHEKVVKGVKYTFPPPMEVLCSPALRYAMWSTKQILKNQMDTDYNWRFYISLKKPEEMKAWDSRYKDAISKINKANKEKTSKAEWDTARVVRGKLTVNGEVIPDPVYPPDVQTMMNLTRAEIEGFDHIEFEVSRDYVLAKSTFRGYCTRATCYRDVEEAYKKLRYEERYATHIMMACLFQDGRNEESFSCDDGEASGGIEILNFLQTTKSVGFMVFVIRWKCGGNMGSRRFGCIKAVAKAALETYKTKMELINNPVSSTPAVTTTDTPPVTTTATTTT